MTKGRQKVHEVTLKTMDGTRLSLARGQFRIEGHRQQELGPPGGFKWGSLAHMYPGTSQMGRNQMPLKMPLSVW